MKVVVTGGRDFDDRPVVFRTLWTLHQERGPFTLLAHGMARGADTLAGEWAHAAGVRVAEFKPLPIEYAKYRQGAPLVRNTRMLVKVQPDLVIAFPGHNGTADCVKKARAMGVEVIEIGRDG